MGIRDTIAGLRALTRRLLPAVDMSDALSGQYHRRQQQLRESLTTLTDTGLLRAIHEFSYFDLRVHGFPMRDTPEVQRFLAAVDDGSLLPGDLRLHVQAFCEAERRLGVVWTEGMLRPGNGPMYLEHGLAMADERPSLEALIEEWQLRRV